MQTQFSVEYGLNSSIIGCKYVTEKYKNVFCLSMHDQPFKNVASAKTCFAT